ncbi:MetQ/NlpA family ABC transporter substrate-binding protein [Enterococcus sp.]|uniref:MetQ/NlpA family ABC transporter substrate-binding protein n=1 Tax=Enterococcus sp. TaxID=35783 RepID=UPI00289AA94F|nr:MetQ/NlpA family ABC transporter substrate-binding protein [Enterococcus sp.]
MKKYLGVSLLFSAFVFAGCGQQADTSASGDSTAPEKVVIGSVGSDAEIWTFIAGLDETKDAGLSIEVKEIDSGPQLNAATVEGEVAVNAFQSLGYLLSFNHDSDTDLVPIATTYMEPMGIYADSIDDIADVPDGAVVALADNPANTARGLRLLESAGLITLSDDFDNGTGTPSDIVDNPKDLTFKLIDDTTGPRILPDVDLALISNTVAFEGGLNVLTDSLYKEEIDQNTKTSINVLATTEENADDPALQKLADLYHSDEVKDYIEDNFGGTKVDVQEDITTLWQDVQ